MYDEHTCPVTNLVFVKIPSPAGFRYKLREMDIVGDVGPDLGNCTDVTTGVSVSALVKHEKNPLRSVCRRGLSRHYSLSRLG